MSDRTLVDFQAEFAQALLADPDSQPMHASALARQPGFAVYRNTVLRGCIDALQANYPVVARLVGEAWFRAAAAIYARRNAPPQPMLVDYGDGFADFLAGFAPAADLPYLPAVARLDRAWTESHLAADVPALGAAGLAAWLRAPADRLASLRLAPHPAARWHWFEQLPAYTIWQRNRATACDAAAIDWRGEGALLTRPAGAVQWRPLSPAGAALLDASAAGAPLGDALAAAGCELHDLGAVLAALLEAGAFAAAIDGRCPAEPGTARAAAPGRPSAPPPTCEPDPERAARAPDPPPPAQAAPIHHGADRCP